MNPGRIDIRDPIHGYINLTPFETALIDSVPVRRLRNICQLGLTDLVFPGATHNRFSHSLGTVHLAGRVFDHLIRQSPEEMLPRDSERSRLRQLLRMASLLHDIGHSPFSHALEDLFDGEQNHETMAVKLIRSSLVSDLIQKHGRELDISAEDIIRVMTGDLPPEIRFLHSIISSELDVDKMDYLLRDSYYCGVAYGHFDIERLLYTITLIPSDDGPRLGVMEGGIHALEAFVLARYYMFIQVYFNATSKVLEKHLEQFALDSGLSWPADPLLFLEKDDIVVFSQLKTARENPHAKRILDRDHFPLAFETQEHLSDQDEIQFKRLCSEIMSRFKPGTYFVSNAIKDPHHFLHTGVPVQIWDGSVLPVARRSSFIQKLRKINQFRIYVEEQSLDTIQKEFLSRWKRSD